MAKQAWKMVASFVAVLVAVTGMAGTALAVDAPKWVAAIYLDAQRSAGLRWQPLPGATGYKVLRSDKPGAGYVEIAAPATPQYFDAAVEPGMNYFYVLQAVVGAEVSANSLEKAITIPGQKKVALEPPVWRSLNANSTTEFGKTTYKVALNWAKSANVVAFNLYRSEVAGKDYALVGSVSEDQYIDVTVQEGKTYYYVITALDNAFQESKYSEEKSVLLEKKKEDAKKADMPNPKIVVKASKEMFRVSSGEGWSLQVPADTVVDSEGNIYVIDIITATIKVFSDTGDFQREIGEKGVETGRIQYPTGIGIDGDDNLYITDRSVKPRVVVMDSKGKFIREILVPAPDAEYMKQYTNKDSMPVLRDVAVGPDGRLYVVDNGLDRMVIVSANGQEFKTVGAPGGDPGQFNAPGWIALNQKTKEVHITNGLNRRVEVFDLEGKFVRAYGLSKSFIGSFVGPTGIAIDKDGNSIVVDSAAATVQFFDPSGAYIYTLGDETGAVDKESKQRADWKIRQPSGISYDAKGGLVVFSLNQDRALMARKIIE